MTSNFFFVFMWGRVLNKQVFQKSSTRWGFWVLLVLGFIGFFAGFYCMNGDC